MTSERPECGDAHVWQPYSDEEMANLRSKTRSGRPPGAWVESAARCERCGKTEARVSWFGQVHLVPVASGQESGQVVVHWPARP